MLKKILGIILVSGSLVVAGFTLVGVKKSTENRPTFEDSGYLLGNGEDEYVKHVGFNEGESYSINSDGRVILTDAEGGRTSVPATSFVYLNNGGFQAMSDGILLDFKDMSDNFINNYYISRGLEIVADGTNYVAETSSGTMTFGENLWKLEDQKYLIQSPHMSVVMSENDVRDVNDYVQVSVTQDGVIQLLTPENLWSTISENCYIETAGGVKIYPVTQIIENNNYKLSVGELSSDFDDSIVLSEDEKRQQVIPAIHIESIDGEDGEDGIEGEAGEDGIEGAAGEAGEIGENGEAGEAGIDGVAGENGSEGKTGVKGSSGGNGTSGSSGSGGGNGSIGSDGDGGANGVTGGSGVTGAKGARGANADTESSTYNALPEMTIERWSVTSTDLAGVILISDESHMLEELAGQAATYPATVTIEDIETGAVIKCYEVTYNSSDDTYSDVDADSSSVFKSIYNGDKAEVPFRTELSALAPDKSYRLKVKAYYKVDSTVYYREFINRTFYTDSAGVYLTADKSEIHAVSLVMDIDDDYRGTIKEVQVILLTPNENQSFTVDSKKYQYKYTITYENGDIKSINGFDSSGTNKKEYSSSDLATLSNTKYSIPLRFGYNSDGSLPSNSSYIARVIVSSTQGGLLNQLTRQELQLKTLKDVPDVSGLPTAAYNRVTGGVEVYRPTIDRKSDGIVSFEYRAYEVITNNNGQKTTKEVESGGSRVLKVNEPEPAVFYLPSGDYEFKVFMNYNDNEKSYTYDLGTSNQVTVVGTALPKVWLQDGYDVTFNSIENGCILIGMDNESSMKVGIGNELELVIYEDQNYVDTITINKQSQEGAYDYTGSARYQNFYKARYDGILKNASSSSASSNVHYIPIKFNNLHANTSYTVDVIAHVNLGADYDTDTLSGTTKTYISRNIGTVGFHTDVVPTLTCTFINRNDSDDSSAGGAINLSASLSLTNAPANPDNPNYEINEAKRVMVEIYSGTDLMSAPIYTTYYYPSSDDNNNQTTANRNTFDYDDANGSIVFDITESNFSGTLKAGNVYTVNIDACVDETYEYYDVTPQVLTYENNYILSNHYAQISAAKVPYEFTKTPESAIKVTPILNKNAANYGGKTDSEQDTDAIVGFALESNYENSAQLAVQVQYYAYEYQAFYNAINASKDPLAINRCSKCGSEIPSGESHCPNCNEKIDIVEPLAKVSVDCGTEYTLPKVAIFFSENTGQTAGTQIGTGTTDGWYAFWGGYRSYDETTRTLSGMGRGFRYIFAYTLTYSTNGVRSDATTYMQYPNGKKLQIDYDTYKSTYGIGYENGIQLGKDVAYILNSGMQRAPLIEPTFHYYVQGTDEKSIKLNKTTSGELITNANTEGVLNLRYLFEDYDCVIKENQTIDLGETSTTITGIRTNMHSTSRDDWGVLSLSYTTDISGNVLYPKTLIDLYYVPNYYDTLLKTLKLNSEIATEDTLMSIPVMWYWYEYIENNVSFTGSVVTNVAENSIVFNVKAQNAAVSFLNKVIAELKIEISARDDTSGTDVTETLYSPMTQVDDFNYTATIRTDKIAKFKGLTPKYDLSIVYVNGMQGWKYASSYYSGSIVAPDGFVIRRTDNNQLTADGKPIFDRDGRYILYSTQESVLPMSTTVGGLFQKDADTTHDKVCSSLENVISENVTKRYYPYFKSMDVKGKTMSGFIGRMMPDYGGVDYTANDDKETIGGKHITVCATSVKKVTMSGGGQGETITEITPSVSNLWYQAGGVSAFVTSVETAGIETAGTDNKVYLALYKDFDGDNKGSSVAGQGLDDDKYLVIKGVEVQLNASGQFKVTKAADGIEIPPSSSGIKLEKDTVYYLIAYIPSTESGKIGSVLLNGTTYTPLVKQVRVASDAEFKTLGTDEVKFVNENYFKKQLSYVYGLKSTVGLSIRYDIYSEDQKAAADTATGGAPYFSSVTPYITQEELMATTIPDMYSISGSDTDYGIRNMLDYPAALAVDENTITIYDYPNSLGAKLKGGEKYYLRLTAYFGDGSTATFSNYKLIEFRMPSNSEYSIHVRTTDVTKEEIAFSLIVGDDSHSTMGSRYNPPNLDPPTIRDNDYSSLYAVAFDYYDEVGLIRRLKTVYDGKLFKASAGRKSFVLNNDTVLSKDLVGNAITITEDTPYIMNVYAVKDFDNNGLSEPAGKDAFADNIYYTYDDLFGKGKISNTTLSVKGKTPETVLYSEAFNKIIDSFWKSDENDKKIDSIGSYEQNFLVTSVTQRTLPENGSIIDPNGISFTLSGNNKVIFKMRNAFGLTYEEAGQIRQTYPKIKWSISNLNTGSTYTKYLFESDHDTMLTRVVDESSGDSYYELIMQIDGTFVSKDPYTAQVNFYENDGTDTVLDSLKWGAVLEP